MRKTCAVLVMGLLGLSLAFAPACGTDAVGIEACREIENVRCDRAPECQIALTTPPPAADPVEGCRRFYLDACLHGLQSAKDPTVAERNACVAALKAGTCDTIRAPERAPECAFLILPDAPPATDAGDATTTDTNEPPPPAPQPDAAR